LIEKAYIFNGEVKGFENGWVHVKIPGCLEETLAVEVIEYMGYAENSWNPLLGKEAVLKSNLAEMPMEAFEEWENAYGHDFGKMEQIKKEVLDAHKVMEALK